MKDRELELEVRSWLDHVIKTGSYNSGVVSSLMGLYYRGRSDVQNEIKNALYIEDGQMD